MKKKQPVVLVADDTEGYRYPLSNILKDNQYKVLEAESVEEVEKLAGEAQIWIIDVRLPSQKEGIEVVRKLIIEKKCKPKFDVIFISVLTQADCDSELENFPEKYNWIEKPFEPEYLLEIVNEMTGRKL